METTVAGLKLPSQKAFQAWAPSLLEDIETVGYSLSSTGPAGARHPKAS